MAPLVDWFNFWMARICYFLMGSLSYYRHEINLWMQPPLAQFEIKQDVAIKTAYQYLQKHASDAKSWYLTVATPESPVNTMYWENQMVVMGMQPSMQTLVKN